MSERANPTNDVGLVLGDDGIVYEVASDGTRTALGNGGSSPPLSEALAGFGDVNIASGAQGQLTWDTLFGDDLLDFTDRAAPVVRAGGIYSVTLTVQVGEAMTDGGWFRAMLAMDAFSSRWGSTMSQDSGTASAANPEPVLTIGNTWYIPEGGAITISVANNDGVQDLDWQFNQGAICKLSGAIT